MMSFPIADCRLPIDRSIHLNLFSATWRGRNWRDGGFSARHIHQPNVSALALQIEIARAPIDPRQKKSG